jgi:plastocyanin
VERRTFLFATAALVTGAAAAKAADAAEAKVVINQYAFSPAELEVKVGTTVEWTNRDSEGHDVTEDKKAFHSPVLDTGDQWKRRFDQPGTVEYYCSLHPHMQGKIRVVA